MTKTNTRNAEMMRQHPTIQRLWVTRNGEVWSEAKAQSQKGNGWLAKQTQKTGYQTVFIRIGGKGRTLHIHRLVAEAWLDNPANLEIVDHIDRNKLNNSVDNLRWVNRSESNTNRCTTRAVECIDTGETFKSTAEAARAYNVSETAIAAACKGKKSYHTIAGRRWRYAKTK